MSTTDDRPSNSEVSESGASRPRRTRAMVQSVLALAVCGGALFWSWRVMWDNSHPVLAAARGLHARAPSDRLAAVDAVSGMGWRNSAEVLHCLVPALRDPDAAVRAAAARSVGLVGQHALRNGTKAEMLAEVWASLLGLLTDRESEVRGAAATSMAIIAGASPAGSRQDSDRAERNAGPGLDLISATDGLIDLLEEPDAGVRLAAISAMGSLAPKVLGDPPRPLLARMEDESAINRAAAVTALTRFRSGLSPLIPILLKHMEHDEQPVRVACSNALGRIPAARGFFRCRAALIAAIGSPDRDVRLHIIALLGQLSPDARLVTPTLIAIVKEPIESDQRVVDRTVYAAHSGPAHAAMEALGQIAPRTESAGAAIAALTEVVRSGPHQRKASAASALGQFGPAAAPAVPALIAFLNEAAVSNVSTRDGAAAAQALARIAPNTPTAGDAATALKAARSSTERLTREAATEALAKLEARPKSSD